MATATKKRYTITLNEDMVKELELTARSINMKPTEYIKLCVYDYPNAIRLVSNLRARLKDCTSSS